MRDRIVSNDMVFMADIYNSLIEIIFGQLPNTHQDLHKKNHLGIGVQCNWKKKKKVHT